MALSYTDASGNGWSIDHAGNVDYGLRSGQYTLDSTSFTVSVGGSTVYPSWGTATASGNVHTVTGTATGLSITREATIGNGFVRVLEQVTNTGAAATTVRLSSSDNIYYDGSTLVAGTSSGDTAVTTADDWALFGTATAGKPVLAHVVSGGAGSPAAVTASGADVHERSWDIALAAGETRVVMHFYALATDTAGATALANSIAGLADPAYLAGMTSAQLGSLANFTQDVTASVTTVLEPYQRNLLLTGSSAINGTGNAQDNGLTGNAGKNVLNGLAGNDTLDGGVGADTMAGGMGNDSYYVDHGGDVVNEAADEGTDTVYSTVSFNMGSRPEVENLVLLGSALINGTGNAAANLLDGSRNTAANVLTGAAGDDTYVLGVGDTAVESSGSGGIDTVQAGFTFTLGANLENLLLTGDAAIDGTGNTLGNQLRGNTAANKLAGGAGNDTLDGGSGGADTLEGGAGNDTYVVDRLGITLVETAGNGTDLVVSSVDHVLGAEIENLQLTGNAVRGTGNAGGNQITGNDLDNVLDGGAGSDLMQGGLGSDVYFVANGGDVVVEAANAGIDQVRTSVNGYTLGANVENGLLLTGPAAMNGNELANAITGNLGANTLTGAAGNDTLDGAGGNDSLDGGEGNDALVGDRGAPETRVASAETVIDGQRVALNISAPEQATGTVVLNGTISAVTLGQTGVNLVYIVDHSGSMNDPFVGAVDVGDLNGDGRSNTVLDAAIASVQKLNATIVQSGLGSQVKVSLVQFDDTAETLYSGSPTADMDSNGLPDLVDRLKGLTADGGTAYNAAMTDARELLAAAGPGQNIVYFLSDGAPTDGTAYQATAAQIRALGQGGTIIRAIGTGTGAQENPLDLLDDGIDNGSALLVTNPEDLDASLLDTSVVEMAEGAWVEVYRNGNLVDLIGSDRFTVGPLGVQFQSNAIALGSSGTDQITAKLMTMAEDGRMIEASIPVRINSFVSNDTLAGGAGDDLLDGGIGTDSLVGGLGNDTYVVDSASDIVVEAAGQGTDTVRTLLASTTLQAEVENLVLIGAALDGTGNAANNSLVGNARDNLLAGGAGNDSLTGDAGNDTLDGGTGNDLLTGGLGDDTFHVDSTSDTVVESSTGGTDTVVTVFSTSLGSSVSGVAYSDYHSYVENLVLAEAAGALNGIGNEGANRLQGNALANQLHGLGGADLLQGGGGNDTLGGGDGNDTLEGGAGADAMAGGAGNDRYLVADAGDTVADTAGVDTIVAGINGLVLAEGIENLVLAASAGILSGTGNALGNSLVGNGLSNVLDGLAGADTMAGGLGNDTYRVDNALDRVVESAGEGTDRVIATASHKLAANVENLTLGGNAGIGGAGNALANLITGNGGANRLLGDGGADTLAGGGGDDTLIGGSGGDRFRFDSALGSGNVDTLLDFTPGADAIQLDDDIFTALGVSGTPAGVALPGAAFQAGAAANDGGDRIIYDQSTGELFYDADGTGAAAQVKFAVVTVGVAVTAANFFVVE